MHRDAILYHGTYAHRLASIMSEGLRAGGAPANWRESDPGCVYLAATPCMAGFMAETAEKAQPDWDVVVIEVSLTREDAARLDRDACVPEASDLFQIRGSFPPCRIRLAEDYRP